MLISRITPKKEILIQDKANKLPPLRVRYQRRNGINEVLIDGDAEQWSISYAKLSDNDAQCEGEKG